MADSAKDILARLSDAPETEVYELIARYSEDPRTQVIKALESAKKRIEKEHAEKTRVEEKCEKCKGKKFVLVRKKFTIKAPKGVNTFKNIFHIGKSTKA